MRWFGWTLVVCVRERAQRGKHRTEVTEATEGDLGWWTKCTWVKIVGSGAGTRQRGKHRTEVTEATEGDLGWWTNALGSRSLALGAGTRAKGKASHRGHGGHRGEIGLVDEWAWVTSLASVREHAQRGKHRTEVTEATEGELGRWANGLGDIVASVREPRAKGKASHRGHGGHRGGLG